MPNLGKMVAKSPAAGAGELEPWEAAAAMAAGPVLADMPGLIEGAHEGRGLGRMFLRHLRRTKTILHVVDASAGVVHGRLSIMPFSRPKMSGMLYF